MNFPVSPIREKCKTVIGVHVSPLTTMKYDKTIKYVIERAMSYMIGANTEAERLKCDYLIESEELSYYSTFDFKHADEIYMKGYTLASAYLDRYEFKIKRTPERKRKQKGFFGLVSSVFAATKKR